MNLQRRLHHLQRDRQKCRDLQRAAGPGTLDGRPFQMRTAQDIMALLEEQAGLVRIPHASAEYDSSVGALFRANDPFQSQDAFDPSRYLLRIFAALTRACQVFRARGLDGAWRHVDRETTFNHYRSGFTRLDEAKVAFEWGCRLLDLGFAGGLREDDILIAWQKDRVGKVLSD